LASELPPSATGLHDVGTPRQDWAPWSRRIRSSSRHAELEAVDPDAARDAEAALEWLTWGAGLAVVTQERLQHFLWYGLPMKWMTDTEHHRRIVAALGRAFDLLGLPRLPRQGRR
jgi:hypothetical protein